MNTDAILQAMNAHGVSCILIGGMNFLLNHRPELTYDVDLWVASEPENRANLNAALHDLGAEWGPTEQSWRAAPSDPAWLYRQNVYCLTTRHGALDIFFDVRGLEGQYAACRAAVNQRRTPNGTPYFSLNDEHMLACQEALGETEQKAQRMALLRAAIAAARNTDL